MKIGQVYDRVIK